MFENHTKSLETCNTCPSLCQSACPVFLNDGNRSHSPWGLMQLMNQVRKGEISLSDISDPIYHCLKCRGCQQQCDHDVDVTPIIHESRVNAVKQEIAPKEITGYIEKFHRHNNPFSKDLLKRLKEILPKNLFKKTDVVYYASCTTISKCPEIIKDTFSLFEKLKIDFVSPYADPIQCCGYPLVSAGAEYDFVDIAEINFHSLKKYKTIITGSPACAFTLKEKYKKYHFNIEDKVVTINEFLQPYLKNINFKLKKNIRSKIMFHDPCYLSRYLKQSDIPRELFSLITGLDPIEFFENHEKSMCAGQGGCYMITNPEGADSITKKRLDECYEKKVNTVVSQCPTCVDKMRKNGNKLVVKDLVTFLNDCIEEVKS